MLRGVVLVDDYRLLRDGVKSILERSGEFFIVAESESGAEAIEICKREPPDLVLIDSSLPDLSGIEASREILRYCPQTGIVMLSTQDDEQAVVAAIRSGVRAILLQKTSAGELIEALRIVAEGGSYLSPQASGRLMTRIQRGDSQLGNDLLPIDRLSRRELQVLRLVAQGKTSKDIAAILDVGFQTVRSYRKTLMKKLGVNNVAGVIQVALSSGLMQREMTDADVMG